jgi:hypothetical protein
MTGSQGRSFLSGKFFRPSRDVLVAGAIRCPCCPPWLFVRFAPLRVEGKKKVGRTPDLTLVLLTASALSGGKALSFSMTT